MKLTTWVRAGCLACIFALAACSGDDGKEGPPGAPGADGAEGTEGAPGAMGAMGDTGATGAMGDTGAMGAMGDTGATGAMGDTGATGAMGDTGPANDPGLNSLVSVATEAPGANCAAGGQAVISGLDDDADGSLDAAEIDVTNYLCNVGDQLVAVSDEPVGDHCAGGGQRIDTGLDGDASGALSTEEIAAGSTQYVCNPNPTYLARQMWSLLYGTPGVMTLASNANLAAAPVGTDAVNLIILGRTAWDPARFDVGASEIVVFKPSTSAVFSVNAGASTVDVGTVASDGSLSLGTPIDVGADLTVAVGTDIGVRSIAYAANDDVLAIAVELVNAGVQQPGLVAFYDVSGSAPALYATVAVGALPDMLTFNGDATKLLVANEGTPAEDYSSDPEGSVSIFNRPGAGWGSVSLSDVTSLDFTAFNVGGSREAEFPSGIRHVGPASSTRSQTLEPEYIAVSPDGTRAWVVLQEQNAMAVLDLTDDSIVALYALGYKDGLSRGNAFDPSDRDDAVNIVNWPVFMLYQPDAIASYSVGSETYYVSANEGDARDDAFSWYEEERLGNIDLDPDAFPDADYWQDNERLGRLNITTTLGDTDGDGDYDDVYAYGGRSFSIWAADGSLVWDSGDDFETITAAAFGLDFNNNDDENVGDTRSDAKGPEPEALTLGEIGGVTYAFIGLERMSGIMVYDVTDPSDPVFVHYHLNRDFSADVGNEDAGDLAPESLVFVAAADSPTGTPLLIAGHEMSGTIVVYEVTP